VRVVAGTARGRRLVAPGGGSVRPTSDRVRESIFNMLISAVASEDLFATEGLFATEDLFATEGLAQGEAGDGGAGYGGGATDGRAEEEEDDELGPLAGARVLDLFAGTGAMGIEALSRGASEAVFVDRDQAAVRSIAQNLASTGMGPGQVIKADALRYVERAPHFDLAFCDPPYDFDGWEALLGSLDAGVAVVESNRQVPPGPRWRLLKERRYGTTVVELLTAGASPPR
jgi:16S rRNA (guanine966-N2)-methyltransferase